MSWLWQNYQEGGEYRAAWQPRSPGFEMDGCCLVNVLLRFDDIFQPLGNAGFKDNGPLENALLRFLALQDLHTGVDRRELQMRRLDKELGHGLWGAATAVHYKRLDQTEKRKLLNLLYEQEKGGLPPLDRVVSVFFPYSRAYKVASSGEIILSLNAGESEKNSSRLFLILELFLPLRQPCLVYWRLTPCLLGKPEAMLGRCVLN